MCVWKSTPVQKVSWDTYFCNCKCIWERRHRPVSQGSDQGSAGEDETEGDISRLLYQVQYFVLRNLYYTNCIMQKLISLLFFLSPIISGNISQIAMMLRQHLPLSRWIVTSRQGQKLLHSTNSVGRCWWSPMERMNALMSSTMQLNGTFRWLSYLQSYLSRTIIIQNVFICWIKFTMTEKSNVV